MLANYLKIAVRNILRHKVYSVINIAGLSVGMACTILILLWVQYELSFDRFHKNADRIYRLTENWNVGTTREKWAVTNWPAGPTFQREYPEVIKAVRFRPLYNKVLCSYKTEKFLIDGILIADDTVFDIFSFSLISGDPGTALSTPFSIVITEQIAEKIFGAEDPIGKVIKIGDEGGITVTGVMHNVPSNSHLSFKALVSFKTVFKLNPEHARKQMENWAGGNINYTYLLLQQNCNVNNLEKKLSAYIAKQAEAQLRILGGSIEYFLQPLTRIHLHSKLELDIAEWGDIAYVYGFTTIALFILLIACINFMNLSTARSANRAKEVGMRKVLGAQRRELVRQFIGESLFFSFISVIFAVMLVELSLPLFRSLSGSNMSFQNITMPWLISSLIGIILIVGFAAGSYPAFFLSAFQPVLVLKGSLKTGTTNSRFRGILVLLQFTVSVALIIGTGIVMNQLIYMKNKKLGFDNEHVVYFGPIGSDFKQSIGSFKDVINGYPEIADVALSSHIPSDPPILELFLPEGFPPDQAQLMHQMSIDHEFIRTLGMELASGRNFLPSISTDADQAALINETAAWRLGWKDPVGKTIVSLRSPGPVTKTIIGVVSDFHIESLHKEIGPFFIENNPSDFHRYILIKIMPGKLPATMDFLREKWTEIFPQQPFDFSFLDETFDRQYKFDEKIQAIFSNFSVLAIFISCLGLFGLASFSAEQRSKEIGIRKAFGASVSEIILLLSKEFTKWVLVANIIAWPIAYVAMNRWLQNFAYRINIGLGTFIMAGVLALVIALLTVGYQAVKAATANPVEALRYQ
ncbi:MAG: ABC transporter permease [Deltaproteobacteria bacterium]|nr:MAG: ABC transporter permease [Deltaproteobacteria bacterium]